MKTLIESKKTIVLAAVGFVGLAVLILLALNTIAPTTFGRLFESANSKTSARVEYSPAGEWPTSTPEEQGLDSAKLADLLLQIRKNDTAVHSLLIVRNGKALMDATFYPYDGKTVHELASVTKSIMTTLIGIAVDQGKLKPDDSMVSFFPERTIANRDARKEQITVRHLATMSSGLQCTAEQDELTLKQMRATSDWVQFALDRPVVTEPGKTFVYCSPSIHLLSPILQKATGLSALEFARQYLFSPLGIQEVKWAVDPQGNSRGSEGVYLLPQDAAKIGQLWLNEGMWNGKQVVSREWVREASKPLMVVAGSDDAYGYGWWVDNDVPHAVNAVGRGGQRIVAVLDWNVVAVMTGGGVDWDSIAPKIVDAIISLDKPLPANPGGVARLSAAVKQVAQAPVPEPIKPLPATAARISGQTYSFEPNALQIDELGMVFDGSAQAVLRLLSTGSGQTVDMPVGLDGVHRWTAMGEFALPTGLRGEWVNDNTFRLEWDAVANNDHIFINATFEDGRMLLNAHETDHELGNRVSGLLKQ